MELKPRIGSVGAFLVLAFVAIAALQIGHTFFPGDHALALAGRQACLVAGIVLLIVGSRWLLKRDAISVQYLGLGLDLRHGRAFLSGAAIGTAHIIALAAVLYLLLPYRISSGSLDVQSVALAAMGYLTGNFVEELLFRGYLLIALARWVGTTRAIWILAIPFGLFHFQGLDGMSLIKMMMTTGAMHFVYAYAFLAFRSLWSAVALHAVGNTLLHKVFGVGEPALLSLQFEHASPAGVDVPFLVFFGVTAALAFGFTRASRTRVAVAEYQLSA